MSLRTGLFSGFARWFSTPKSSPSIDRKNFVNVQIDAIGVALGNAAAPFLPVFLARLNATNLQISLLTAMPAITGLLLAIPLGRLLQNQRQIIPWFSAARLAVISSYALTGVAAIFVPAQYLVYAILAIWALATIPQTIVAICFSVVMNAVAGPQGRYELMTRRWSLLGLTTTITVFSIGQILDNIVFPSNYQLVFIALSIGGLISYYFSSHIVIPDQIANVQTNSKSFKENFSVLNGLVRKEKAFLAFMLKRFVFMSGIYMAVPLFPIYFVREIHASDSWIAAISMAQTAVMVIGYFFWSQQSRHKGSRNVLIWTTLGLSLYPMLTALTHQTWQIAIYAGIAGIFQAGLDLVFFDELMSTIPPEYSATFVSVAQSMQFFSAIFSPIIGSGLVSWIGVGPALVVAGGLRLAGFVLFAKPKAKPQIATPESGNVAL